jgi:Zn-finger nucleic acid-binding protein
MANEYLRWRLAVSAPERTNFDEIAPAPTWDIDSAKICPNCQHLMLRYNVLPYGSLILDRCGSCNGIWLDPHEWDSLVAQHLEYQVNDFFTAPWQSKIRAAEAHRMLDKLYADKFGSADYAKVREMDAWLRKHPQRPMLLAFLQSRDPYKL